MSQNLSFFSSPKMRRRISLLKWRLIRLGPILFYRLGLGSLIGRMVLLLTTTGRKTGRPHKIPLQYEEIDGLIYVGAARGPKADWFRNISANPLVTVQIGSQRFRGEARPISDPVEVANFMEVRLQRHPRMVGAIMRRAGLPRHPSRADLETYAGNRAIVIIHPRL